MDVLLWIMTLHKVEAGEVRYRDTFTLNIRCTGCACLVQTVRFIPFLKIQPLDDQYGRVEFDL